MLKLDTRALGLTLGIIWGACVLIMGLTTIYLNFGAAFVGLLSTLYPGYKPTILGSVIGGIYGFIDAGIGGVILAWLYNKIS